MSSCTIFWQTQRIIITPLLDDGGMIDVTDAVIDAVASRLVQGRDESNVILARLEAERLLWRALDGMHARSPPAHLTSQNAGSSSMPSNLASAARLA